MAVLEIRQRIGWLFVAVVFAHLVLISAQAKTARGMSMLSSIAFGTLAGIQGVATSAVGGVKHAWQDYFALQEIRQQNEQLQQQVGQLQIALQQERTEATQSRSLQDLLTLKRELPLATKSARVIGYGPGLAFRTMNIDKGTDDGLLPDMAVIAPSGVVGRVYWASPGFSKVQLLIDRNAAAGAIVERSRVQGVVEGNPVRFGLLLKYVSSTADIKVGDRVVTSGIDGIFPAATELPSSGDASSATGGFPKGFVIGQIESLEKRGGQYDNVVVRPAVDFSTLESVLVVLKRPTGEAIDAAIGRQSAATGGNEAR
jgi:rod shape-determining protein MreC